MPCEFVDFPKSGGFLIVCGRRAPKRVSCKYDGCVRTGTKLCDYPTWDGKTCDNRACAKHSRRVASDTDHCYLHWDELFKVSGGSSETRKVKDESTGHG